MSFKLEVPDGIEYRKPLSEVSYNIRNGWVVFDQTMKTHTIKHIPTHTYATLHSYRIVNRKTKNGLNFVSEHSTINWLDNDNYDSGGRYTYTKSKVAKNANKHHWFDRGADVAVSEWKGIKIL